MVFREKKEKGLLNFLAIDGKDEGVVIFSGAMDAGEMVRDGEDVLEFGVFSGVSLSEIVLIEDCVVARECEGGNTFDSAHQISFVLYVSLSEPGLCCMILMEISFTVYLLNSTTLAVPSSKLTSSMSSTLTLSSCSSTTLSTGVLLGETSPRAGACCASVAMSGLCGWSVVFLEVEETRLSVRDLVALGERWRGRGVMASSNVSCSKRLVVGPN